MRVDEKHYSLNRNNLMQPIRIQLYQKQKAFSEFIFFSFLKPILNFKYLPKKEDPHSWYNSGNTGSEKYGLINVQKAVFQTTLRKRTLEMGPNTVAIWMAGPFQYLIITV